MPRALFLLLICGLVGPAALAQVDPVDVLDRLEATRQSRIADVQNYTVVVKSPATNMPSVEYYERALDGASNAVAAFRLVPESELANRRAAAAGEASAQQKLDGLGDAIEAIGGVLGEVALEVGMDVNEAAGRSVGDVADLFRSAGDTNADPNADAVGSLQQLEMLRANASSARETMFDGVPAYAVVAENLDAELEGSTADVRNTATKMTIYVDRARMVVLALIIEGESRPAAVTASGSPLYVSRVDSDFQSVAPSSMLEPACSTTRLVLGGAEQSATVSRKYVAVNQGPPTAEQKAQWVDEFMDDYAVMNCGAD